MTRPTAAQAALIRYFNGGPPPTSPVKKATYEVCRRRGWIERIEEFPFHRATDEGRRALEPAEPSTAAATEKRRRIGDEKRAEILRSHGWTVTPPASAGR